MFTVEKLLFIFKGRDYYVYDLEEQQLSQEYLKRDYVTAIRYPLSITDFNGIPESVDSAFALKGNVFYFFLGSFLFRLTGLLRKYEVTVKLVQEEFIECTDYEYSKTEYKNFEQFKEHLMNYSPRLYEGPPTFSTADLVFIVLVSMTLIAIVVVLYLICSVAYERHLQYLKYSRPTTATTHETKSKDISESKEAQITSKIEGN
ncbi:hypothetical protein B4U80_12047 [Leptotrombidium deliense]|uniref:Uncharacterized protein n=1 Tax=Leptotrombidium deliense TaxID=299467 RepID=A0A443RZC5_9ACAR|nr:hypothetical protein B4U80_12047 [Leptotrombidium deliense]